MFEDTPAKAAEVKKHDILLAANEKDLKEITDLIDVVEDAGKDGEKVGLTFIRGGETNTITIEPEERPKREGAFGQLGKQSFFGSSDVEGQLDDLREQVEALTDMVHALVEQKKDEHEEHDVEH